MQTPWKYTGCGNRGYYDEFHTYEFDQYKVITDKNKKITDMWREYGNTAIKFYVFSSNELPTPVTNLKLDDIPLELLPQTTCTTCGRVLEIDEGIRTLFAGKICLECYEMHKKNAELEKYHGFVCSKCGKPYSECYC